MHYTVYDSSVSSYYQNYIYTPNDWVVFDISDTTTIMLIGSYALNGNSISGTTQQIITIQHTGTYGSTPTISIDMLDDREDTITYSSDVSYRMVSNIEDAPTQKNSTYETQYKTYQSVNIILIALVFAFIYTFIKGVLTWYKK